MIKTRIITMIIFFGIFLALSCEKDKPEPLLPYDDVFGNWEWVSTMTGWGVTTDADSVSYEQSLEVTRQGKYNWKRNDTIIRQENFSIDVDTIEGNQLFTFRFDNSVFVDQSFFIEHKDTLRLTDQCADCDTYIFVRQ